MIQDLINSLTLNLMDLDSLLIQQDQKTRLDNDEAATLIDKIKVAKAKFREITEVLKTAELEAVDELGEVTIGEIRFYIALSKKTRQTADTDEIVGAIAEADLPITAFLVKQPFKAAAVEAAVGRLLWSQFFSVEIDRDVKTGKARREVRGVDPQFLPKAKNGRKGQDDDH